MNFFEPSSWAAFADGPKTLQSGSLIMSLSVWSCYVDISMIVRQADNEQSQAENTKFESVPIT